MFSQFVLISDFTCPRYKSESSSPIRKTVNKNCLVGVSFGLSLEVVAESSYSLR